MSGLAREKQLHLGRLGSDLGAFLLGGAPPPQRSIFDTCPFTPKDWQTWAYNLLTEYSLKAGINLQSMPSKYNTITSY